MAVPAPSGAGAPSTTFTNPSFQPFQPAPGSSTVFTDPSFQPGPAFQAAHPQMVANPYAGSYPGVAPPPPTPTPDPSLIAPNVDYVGQFQASMGRQRQALDNALATSLSQLGGRRDAAAKVVAAIPGQVQQTFQQAQGQQANVQGNADKASGAKVKGGSVGGDANAGLYANELKANEGAGKAVEPLLQLGATANYDLGAAGLQQQHLEGVSQLDQQQAAFDQAQAQAQQQEQWQATVANYQQSIAPKTTFAQEETLKGIDPATGVPFSVESGGKAVDPKTGLTADQTAHATQARDDQANRAGYSSYAGWQQANVQGAQLAQVLSDPHAGSDALKIVSGHIQGNADLRNWFKINAPGLYAQFQTMNGKTSVPGSKTSANPAFP